MSGPPEAFAAALEAALAAPEGAGLARAIPMPAQTAIVVDPALGEAAGSLGTLAEALARQGIPRGRLDLVVAACGDPAARRACGLAAGRALGLSRAHLHDPAHGDHFTAGSLDGVPLEVADVLREAEAVIAVGRDGADGPPWRAIVPGVVSARTAAGLERAGGAGASRMEALLALVRVDWAVRFEGGVEGRASGARAGTPARVWRARSGS